MPLSEAQYALSDTWKEILGQGAVWQSVLRELPQNKVVQQIAASASRRPSWLFVGCGTSYYLAEAAANSWSQLTGEPASALPASDLLLHRNLPRKDDSDLRAVVISRSGKTSEAVRAAVNSRSSIFIYGAPGNGKTTLARRIPSLLGGPIVVPVALDIGGGEVMTIFDGSVHRLETNQPADRRWRRVARPLVQVGGEFQREMFDPTWEDGSRTYGAPLQVKANGGVLLIDDLGRQRVSPKQILDRLLVPLEQDTDYMNLSATGRKVEVPFQAQLALSTNLRPAELLDEAYLRRLSYKVLMPDPTWDMWTRIFERERQRLSIPPDPNALEMISTLYSGRPLRGNHPRDLLERLVDVSSARGVRPQLTPDLVEAAWHTLFITS